MGTSVVERLPFKTGKYAGHGGWADREGQRGLYTTEFQIVARGDHDKVQHTRRIFLKDDGTVAHEDHSRITFEPLADGFVAVAFNHEGKEYQGQGYCFRNLCHYEVELAEGIRLENTYVLSQGRIELIGSSTNKGNYTVWAELSEEVLQ